MPRNVRNVQYLPRFGWMPVVVAPRDAGEPMDPDSLALVPALGQFVPGKVFEIIVQNRQVLVVLPPGDARDILEELDWGVIAEPEAADIERAIERLLALPPPARPADPDGKHDRVALAQRLADTLLTAVEAPHRPRPARAGRPTAGHLA